MKKTLKLLPVVLLSTSLLLQGCGANSQQSNQASKTTVKKISLKKVEYKEPVNTQGRIISNPQDGENNFTATSQGNWVYYIYTSFNKGDAGLKKFNLNDEKQMDFNKLYYGQYGKAITKDYIKFPRQINVVGNLIYFVTQIDSKYYICKINNDGSEFKRLTDLNDSKVLSMIVTKDYIYYDMSSGDGYTDELHILNVSDGSEKKVIKEMDSFNICNNSLYYTCKDNNNKWILYKYDLSNDQSSQLFTSDNEYGEEFYIYNDKIYFIKDCLNAATFNSSNIEKLTDDNVNSFLMYKEKIYFISKTNSDKLYSMDLDGKNLKKIDDGDCSYLTILNNRLYYQVKDGDSSFDNKFKTIELDKNK